MWLSSSKADLNYRTQLFLIILSIIITSTTIAAIDQNVTLSSSTSTTTTTPRKTPTQSSRPLASTPRPTPPTSSPPRPRSSTASTLPPTRPTTSGPKPSPSSTIASRTRNRTPSLEEFPVVDGPRNNDINETEETGQVNDTTTEKPIHGHVNSTRKEPTKSKTNLTTTTMSILNGTVPKTTKRKNVRLPHTKTNYTRRKTNLTTKRRFNNSTIVLTNSNTTTNNDSSILSSLSSKTFPKGTTLGSASNTEHAKMCSLGDTIIPATCFSCRCDFNGIFNQWNCIKDDLCMWANHNANLAKRDKIQKGTPTTRVPFMKKIGSTNGDTLKPGTGIRAESERCRVGQYYQDECQYCICAINGLYQCSDLCSRLGGPMLPYYNGPGQNPNPLSGPNWNSGAWTGNNPNFYNDPSNSGGAYNPQWGWDYPFHRQVFDQLPQWTPPPTPTLNDNKNKIPSVVKPERKTRSQKTKSQSSLNQ